MSKLEKVHPVLRERVTKLIENLAAQGRDVRVVQGLRTYEEQNALYAQGRTKPGKRVTNAIGGQSNHNFGLAVDLCPFTDGKPNWNDTNGFRAIGREAKALGLEWGGDWKFVDMPHVQLRGMSVKECQSAFKAGGLSMVWQRMNALMGGAKPALFVPAEDDLLEFGDRGKEVERIQRDLLALGFLHPHEVDGVFGKVTKNAVVAFQRQNNLTADGIVGAGTKAKLSAATSLNTFKSETSQPLIQNSGLSDTDLNQVASEKRDILPLPEQATEETQASTPEGETQIVKTLNEQDVNQKATVAETKLYNGIGFWATVKRDLAAVTGGNLTFQGLTEYAQQANNFPQWLVPIIGKLALVILVASVGYLIFRVIHYLADSWKQAQRVRVEAEAKTRIDRKDLVWTQPDQ